MEREHHEGEEKHNEGEEQHHVGEQQHHEGDENSHEKKELWWTDYQVRPYCMLSCSRYFDNFPVCCSSLRFMSAVHI